MLIEIWRLELAPPQRKLAPPPRRASQAVASGLPRPVCLACADPPFPNSTSRLTASLTALPTVLHATLTFCVNTSPNNTASKASNTEHALVPLQTYVCDVIRQSRTTRSVLQSALCYIAAIRNKVSVLIDSERGEGIALIRPLAIEEQIEVPLRAVVQHQKLD